MGQTYTNTNPATGTTTFGELYAIIRNHIDACATLFVGASEPGSPETGRPWFQSTDQILRVYSGSTWQWTYANTPIETEVSNARGSHSSLDARLDVSINEDGTLSGTSPAGAWWTSGTTPWDYHSTTQWKEGGDVRAVYTVGRAIKFNGVANAPQYSYVTAVTYAATTTTINVKDAVIDVSMTTPEFGQSIENFHRNIPWTRGIFSNSATSRDYAGTSMALVADGSGGVTVQKVLSPADTLSDHKKYGLA